MPKVAEVFFKAAIVFLILGILMGLQMSISGKHNVVGAHAHTNLLGWVTMALFGGYYALNAVKAESRLAKVHLWTYLSSVVVMTPSLYLLYLGYPAIEPLLAISSLVALASVLIFAVIVFSKVEEKVTSMSGPAVAG
jgi:hypothetical protein